MERAGKRNSNIEILRIISMLLIVAFHSLRSFTLSAQTTSAAVNNTLILLGSWGILGVDLFVIISAWFLTEQKFKIKRVINIAFQVFTYVLLFTFLFFVKSYIDYGFTIDVLSEFVKKEISAFFQPFWGMHYWFITTYIFMVIASPLSNKLLNTLSQTQMKKVLLILIFIPIYAQYNNGYICDSTYFIYVYLLIGYLKKYPSQFVIKLSQLKWIITAFVFIIGSKFAVLYIKTDLKIFYILTQIFNNTTIPLGRNSVVVLILSIMIFFYTINLKPRYNKFINTVSGCTLGVYLLHENNLLGLPNVIDSVFDKFKGIGFFSNNYMFFFQYLAVVTCVFIIGIAVEYIRQKIIQEPFMKWIDKKQFKFIEKADDWFNTF